MRFIVLVFLFSQYAGAADGAHGFITYLQSHCSGSAAETKLMDQMEKLDAFSFKRDVLLKKLEQAKFKCLKARLSDYAFKMNPTMRQIHDQREYRLIFSQLALYTGSARGERRKLSLFKTCNVDDPTVPNECIKHLSRKLIGDYAMLSVTDKLLEAVGTAIDQHPELSLSSVESSVDRDLEAEIRKMSAKAKAATEFSAPTAVR